jgi:eukaryotic-like serine/threonine-protein kinase
MPVSEHVAERAESRVGTLLRGKWRLDRVLGVGGMAVVFAATHRNQARVAIKMLHPEVALDQEVTERFLREGYLANSVDHPGIVKVLDDDVSEDGAPFLVMELLDGETLEARWARKGRRLPVSEVLMVTAKVLDVLAAAHAKGVIHRDLKPENLFLTRTGEIKILDFGIARLHEISHDTKQTRAGSVMGTPAFMSPEQARGRWDEVDGRTDIWAVGATLFTLLAGRYVHEGETIQEQLIMAATQPAPGIEALVPGLSPSVVELVDRALAYDKSARWRDVPAMIAALRVALEIGGLGDRLTLPSPSSPGVEAQTIVAPPELTSAITGASGALTARAFTSSARSPRPNRRGALLAFSSLLVLAVGAGTLWHFSSRAPSDPLTAPIAATPADPEPVEIGPLGTAAPDVPVPPASSLSVSPLPPSLPTAAGRPPKSRAGDEKPASSSKPIEPPANQGTGSTTKTNPFDRRL